jgi:cytochrome c oxidase subunit 2
MRNQNFTEMLGLAQPWQFGFQIPASPVMEGIVNFHHDLFFFLVVIIGFVAYVLYRSTVLFNSEANTTPKVVTHAPELEIIWTIIPALILVLIAIPSFSLLYSMDEIVEPLLTIKIIGHQWYWSYEFVNPYYLYKDILKLHGLESLGNEFFAGDSDTVITYDSYMISNSDSQSRAQRLLEVDNKLYLPIETNVRLLITSGDVIHSWAVPALGIKMDACPGRLNQTSLYIKRPGVFYGQCSEICGVNHGFMPIVVLGLDLLGDGTTLDSVRSEGITSLYFFFLKKRYG